MSHNVEYYRYPLNVSKDKVKADFDNYVAHADWQEGCCGLYHGIRWLSDKTYKDYQEAHDAIDRLDRGNYDNLAVMYYQSDFTPDEKYNELKAKVEDARKEFESRALKNYPSTITSAFMGCKNCGSKLARLYLQHNSCPVCGRDLRPEYMIKSVEAAKSRYNKAVENACAYKERKSKKKVMWLVKIEYHT